MISTRDDAELLEDLRGLGRPQLFDGNVTETSFFPESEDDSIVWRHMDDVVDTSPDKCHRHQRNGQSGEPAHRETADSVH